MVEELDADVTAAEETQPGIAVPVALIPMPVPSREQKLGQTSRPPSNLVTAWGPHSGAVRVIVAPALHSEEAGQAPETVGKRSFCSFPWNWHCIGSRI